MLSVSEASALVFNNLLKPKEEFVSISGAVGRILAESIVADRNLPPFNRATMDGAALDSKEFRSGRKQFKILATLAAGQPAISLNDPAGCVEVMTGAVLPAGTDTVVRYEDLSINDGVADVMIPKLSAGENIHFISADAKIGELLLTPGLKISAAEVALLASVGKTMVKVFAFPRTAIISTGDELVPIDQIPLPHQIRRSNGYALLAALQTMGCTSTQHHLPDHEDVLTEKLKEILSQNELVILSGGVSKGKFDFVPQVLASLGVEKLFHQVRQRPGKPFWFGRSADQTVFALPGNPVSTYMCFYRYIKPWLLKSLGTTVNFQKAILATDFTFKFPLTYFLQVSVLNEEGKLMAYPEAGG
jgi:molybdopterin molybdotransferase